MRREGVVKKAEKRGFVARTRRRLPFLLLLFLRFLLLLSLLSPSLPLGRRREVSRTERGPEGFFFPFEDGKKIYGDPSSPSLPSTGFNSNFLLRDFLFHSLPFFFILEGDKGFVFRASVSLPLFCYRRFRFVVEWEVSSYHEMCE